MVERPAIRYDETMKIQADMKHLRYILTGETVEYGSLTCDNYLVTQLELAPASTRPRRTSLCFNQEEDREHHYEKSCGSMKSVSEEFPSGRRGQGVPGKIDLDWVLKST